LPTVTRTFTHGYTFPHTFPRLRLHGSTLDSFAFGCFDFGLRSGLQFLRCWFCRLRLVGYTRFTVTFTFTLVVAFGWLHGYVYRSPFWLVGLRLRFTLFTVDLLPVALLFPVTGSRQFAFFALLRYCTGYRLRLRFLIGCYIAHAIAFCTVVTVLTAHFALRLCFRVFTFWLRYGSRLVITVTTHTHTRLPLPHTFTPPLPTRSLRLHHHFAHSLHTVYVVLVMVFFCGLRWFAHTTHTLRFSPVAFTRSTRAHVGFFFRGFAFGLQLLLRLRTLVTFTVIRGPGSVTVASWLFTLRTRFHTFWFFQLVHTHTFGWLLRLFVGWFVFAVLVVYVCYVCSVWLLRLLHLPYSSFTLTFLRFFFFFFGFAVLHHTFVLRLRTHAFGCTLRYLRYVCVCMLVGLFGLRFALRLRYVCVVTLFGCCCCVYRLLPFVCCWC